VFFVKAQELQHQAFVSLETGSFSDEPEFNNPSLHLVTATREKLEAFLGDQAYLLSHQIHLIEVFAGSTANTSKQVEVAGGNAIRIGLAWGQDLSTAVNRALLLELAKYVCPEHVVVAWQCTSVAGFSQLNYVRHEQSRPRIDSQRQLVGHWVNLFGDLYMIQHSANRFCHAENPSKSLAWLHPRIPKLPNLLIAEFDQCMYGLKSPRPPHKHHHKTTYLATNSPVMFNHMSTRCNRQHDHEPLEGSYQGVSLTKTAENYPVKMAKILVQAMIEESNCKTALPAESLENKTSQ
jgi:hypothetical protein